MQLTTIEQCSVGQVLYHPIFGEGRVTGASKGKLYVWFDDGNGNEFGRIFEEVNKRQRGSIYNLYTEPVYICEKALVAHRNDFGDHEEKEIYLPINPD